MRECACVGRGDLGVIGVSECMGVAAVGSTKAAYQCSFTTEF